MKREIWIDNVKVLACFLVVIGHLLQSFVKADIIADTNIYQWFIRFIYYFHVPAFFFASGYLYQLSGKVTNFLEYRNNLGKKLMDLIVPYLTFSIITYVIKTILSNQVNNEIQSSLLKCLVQEPIAPYWFLYTLFLCFLVFPTLKSKKAAIVLLAITLLIRMFRILGFHTNLFFIDTIISYGFYFLLGAFVKYRSSSELIHKKNVFLVSLLVIPISIIVSVNDIYNSYLDFIITLLGILFLINISFRWNRKSEVMASFAKYFMPIYVLHTICASSLRILLVKLNIDNAAIHIITGGVGSFMIPIIIAMIAEKTIYLNFFFYPVKTLKQIGQKHRTIYGQKELIGEEADR